MKVSILIVIATAGCSHSGVSNVRSLAKSETIAQVKTQKISLNFRRGNTPGLLANVEIKGRPFQFLVDTGAANHGVSQKIVKMFGLHETGSMEGSTPYGDVQMSHVEDLDVKISGVAVRLSDILADSLPAPGGLEEDGILGIISPPRFAVDSLAVLDIVEPALYIVTPIPTDILAWLKTTFKQMEFDEVIRHDHPGEYKQIVYASAGPFGQLEMFLDSGATTTNLYSRASFGKSKPVTIRINNHECLARNARFHRLKPSEHRDQLIGMDCLRGKILAFPPDDHAAVWIGWPKGNP